MAAEDDLLAMVAALVEQKLAERQQYLTGTVTGLAPVTARLDNGDDVTINLQQKGAVLAEGMRVTVQRSGSGYVQVTDVELAGTANTHATHTHSGEVPVGGVVAYSGAWNGWPSNWRLCDGTNGTVSLTGRFIYGTLSNGSDHLTTGGSSTHNHTGGTHNHPISAGGGHTHGGTGTQNQSVLAVTSGGTAARLGNHDHPISSDGSHSHGGDTGNAGGSVNTSTDSNLPPYLKLAWIQRMS